MGISIFVQGKQFRAFKLAKHLIWLGIFGVIHALAEWTHMFNVVLRSSGSFTFLDELRALEAILMMISFLFLMVFSARVFKSFPEKRHVIRILHPLTVISWFMALFMMTHNNVDQNVFSLLQVLTRHFICFPSALLAAYSFFLQARNLQESKYHKLRKYLYGVTVTFALYAVFAGMIIREPELSLSNYLTFAYIENTTGIPVPIYRAAIASGIAYFLIQSMRLFNLEYSTRLAQAEKANTLMQERARISGDLHDGTIQTLYGISLLLENSQVNIHEEVPKEQINYALSYLNDSIQELRLFITSLGTPSLSEKSFSELIVSRAELFSQAKEGLSLSTNYPSFDALDWLSPDNRYHVLCIAQEVLANIIKHSNAKEIKVYCEQSSSSTALCIEDNGYPVDMETLLRYQGSGLGLRSITARARHLGADWSWENKKEFGNIFRLNLTNLRPKGDVYGD